MAIISLISKLDNLVPLMKGRKVAAARPRKFVITGGSLPDMAKSSLDNLFDAIGFDERSVILTGNMSDVDRAANNYALSRGIETRTSRSPESVLDEAPDFVIALPGGEGTGRMIDSASVRGIPVARIDVDNFNRILDE